MSRRQLSRKRSFLWGLATFLIAVVGSTIISAVVSIPLLPLLLALLFYYFYVKKRVKVRLSFYLLGLFFTLIFVAVILGAALFSILTGGWTTG